MLMQLGSIGLLVALLPLSMVWVSDNPDKYRKLVWVTLFLTFDLIMFGAFTRLTDSGLGCPDWPGCYGQADPMRANGDISAAEAAMPTGPVTVMKAWIEMLHRYLAMAIGVLLISIMAIAWRRWWKTKDAVNRFSPVFPTLLLGFVGLQGAFGAFTVTMKLQPVIVTTHLILGMGLLALLTWYGSRHAEHLHVTQAARRLRPVAILTGLLLALQVALGGWVSSNYATLACTDFPLCQGSLLPAMDFEHGFTLWRELGKTASGEYLPFAALTAIHLTHRAVAFIVVILVTWLGIKSLRIAGLRKTAIWLLMAILLQFSTGVLTVFLDSPLALAVIHNGGAALLVLLMVVMNYKVRLSG